MAVRSFVCTSPHAAHLIDAFVEDDLASVPSLSLFDLSCSHSHSLSLSSLLSSASFPRNLSDQMWSEQATESYVELCLLKQVAYLLNRRVLMLRLMFLLMMVVAIDLKEQKRAPGNKLARLQLITE